VVWSLRHASLPTPACILTVKHGFMIHGIFIRNVLERRESAVTYTREMIRIAYYVLSKLYYSLSLAC
jgi:hypothetical protein